jgi:hypothetical protein
MKLHRAALSDCFARQTTCRVKALEPSAAEGYTEGERLFWPSPDCTARQKITPFLPRPIDELGHWMYNQLVKCVRTRQNRRTLWKGLLPGNRTCAHTESHPQRVLLFSRQGDDIGAMRRACIGSPTERPATTTNRDSRPALGKGRGYRSMRDGVTGNACTEWNCPSLALGLYSTDGGIQAETVIPPYHPAEGFPNERNGDEATVLP